MKITIRNLCFCGLFLTVAVSARAQQPDHPEALRQRIEELERKIQQLQQQLFNMFSDSLGRAWEHGLFSDSLIYDGMSEDDFQRMIQDFLNQWKQYEGKGFDRERYDGDTISRRGDTTYGRLGPLQIMVIQKAGADEVEVIISGRNRTWYYTNRDDRDSGKERIRMEPRAKNVASQKPAQKLTTEWLGLGLGFNNYVTSEFGFRLPQAYRWLEPMPGPSIGVHLPVVSQQWRVAHPLYLRYGISLEFNSYKFNNQQVLQPHADSVVFEVHDATLRKNKLSTDYIGVPIMLIIKLRAIQSENHIAIGAGVFGSYLLGARTKVKTNGGEKSKVKDTFNLNPLRSGLIASVGYGNVALFGTYSLSPLFLKGMEPVLYPTTVGIHFSF